MRRAFYVAGVILACVLAYQISTRWTLRAQGQISVKPFTLEFGSYDSAGKLIEDRITARRSDGSEAMRIEHGASVGRRVDFMEGASMTVWDALGAKMSGWPRTEQTQARRNAC